MFHIQDMAADLVTNLFLSFNVSRLCQFRVCRIRLEWRRTCYAKEMQVMVGVEGGHVQRSGRSTFNPLDTSTCSVPMFVQDDVLPFLGDPSLRSSSLLQDGAC